MAENLKSDPSEWETGKSDPKEFTVEAVKTVLESADDKEKKRVADADDRKTVDKAAEGGTNNSGDENKSGDGSGNVDPGGVTDNDSDKASKELPPTQGQVSEEWDYDPYSDPDVPSTAIADVIVAEYKGLGKSPTLDGIKAAKKEAEKNS